MTLRRRLLIALFGLSAIGIIAAGVTGTWLLRRFALQRVDRQLAGFGRVGTGGPPGRTGDSNLNFILRCDRIQLNPQGILVEYYSADGTVACAPQSASDPGGGPVIKLEDLREATGQPFSVASHNGGADYRVTVRQSVDGVFTVRAISLKDAEDTWHTQAIVNAIVGSAVLVMLTGVGWMVIRRDLRPLERITDTADAITKGDLSQRVDVDQPATEVGRLGTAFNTMLASIQGAFAEQRKSDEKLRHFVADASHELRTPLTSIRGYAEFYRTAGAENATDTATMMRHIEREATRMSGLVDDLLLLAKFDDQAPLQFGVIDLSRIIDDTVNDFRAADPEREVTVRVVAPVEVIGDDARLRQVVTNLLANVRVHTPAGSPVEVTAQQFGNLVEVAVIDHGPGVPADQIDHVFERFTRLDHSRTRASGGSGLGLAIVHAIVQSHQGTVRVEPTEGGGATFVMSLPAHEPVTARPAS